MSICRFAGIYDFIELGQRVCSGPGFWGVGGDAEEEKQKGKRKWPVCGEDGKIWTPFFFFFSDAFSVHIWSLFWPIYQESQRATHDPAPQTDMISAVSLRVQFDPVSPKVKGHLQGAAN